MKIPPELHAWPYLLPQITEIHRKTGLKQTHVKLLSNDRDKVSHGTAKMNAANAIAVHLVEKTTVVWKDVLSIGLWR